MSPSDKNTQLALKALLFLVVGANFIAGLRLSDGLQESYMSAVDEAVPAARLEGDGGGSAGGLGADKKGVSVSPPDTDVAAALKQLKDQVAALEATREHSPLEKPTAAAPVGLQVSAEGVEVCERKYSIAYFIAALDGETKTRMVAHEGTSLDGRPVAALDYRSGDARDANTRGILRTEMARDLRALSSNQSCEAAASPTERQNRVADCEVGGDGKSLDDGAALKCDLNRLGRLGSEDLRGDALFSEMEAIAERLKEGLHRMASGDCSGLHGLRCDARDFKAKIQAALRSQRSYLADARGEHISATLDKKLDKLIAGLDQAIASVKAEKAAQAARDEADHNREEAQRLAKDIRDTEKDLRDNHCPDPAQASYAQANSAVCAAIGEQLTDLRQDRRDLFDETYAAEGFQSLIDRTDGLDPRVANDLLRSARQPYLQALNAIRQADPLDILFNQQMDQAFQQIGRGAGISQANMAQMLATPIDPRTGLPINPGSLNNFNRVLPGSIATPIGRVGQNGISNASGMPGFSGISGGVSPAAQMGLARVVGTTGGGGASSGFAPTLNQGGITFLNPNAANGFATPFGASTPTFGQQPVPAALIAYPNVQAIAAGSPNGAVWNSNSPLFSPVPNISAGFTDGGGFNNNFYYGASARIQ